jgi:hypothetical protein
MMKVAPGCTIVLQFHVIIRHTEGMADIQSQEL